MIRSLAFLLATLIGASASMAAGSIASSDLPKSSPVSTQFGSRPQIDMGFRLLYSLKFEEARRQFAAWQQINPGDPLGYVAAAASYMFEEFHDQNVLTSNFFLDDKRLLGGIQGEPDARRKMSFEAADRKGKELALKKLNADSRDADALFALAAATGLQANFEAILEKRQRHSLALIQQAKGYAAQVLALQPDHFDAWFSLGAANYIIGSMPAYKRLFLGFGRIRGDKSVGMEQLRITAEKGHYLKPFAQIFLALAAMREKQNDLAKSLLRDLAAQFPENPLFQPELDRLEGHYAGLKSAAP